MGPLHRLFKFFCHFWDHTGYRLHLLKCYLKYVQRSFQFSHIFMWILTQTHIKFRQIFFQKRKVLWTLKSNLVLFLGMSFTARHKIYFRGTWSEMPMDEFRQLSVTFPDCFVSSVLGAVSVVTFTSYYFSTGGKQHISLFKFFIERYMKISFSGAFFVFSFKYYQIIIVKC